MLGRAGNAAGRDEHVRYFDIRSAAPSKGAFCRGRRRCSHGLSPLHSAQPPRQPDGTEGETGDEADPVSERAEG